MVLYIPVDEVASGQDPNLGTKGVKLPAGWLTAYRLVCPGCTSIVAVVPSHYIRGLVLSGIVVRRGVGVDLLPTRRERRDDSIGGVAGVATLGIVHPQANPSALHPSTCECHRLKGPEA